MQSTQQAARYPNIRKVALYLIGFFKYMFLITNIISNQKSLFPPLDSWYPNFAKLSDLRYLQVKRLSVKRKGHIKMQNKKNIYVYIDLYMWIWKDMLPASIKMNLCEDRLVFNISNQKTFLQLGSSTKNKYAKPAGCSIFSVILPRRPLAVSFFKPKELPQRPTIFKVSNKKGFPERVSSCKIT